MSTVIKWLFRAALYGFVIFLIAHSIVACGGGGCEDTDLNDAHDCFQDRPRIAQCDKTVRECV